MATLVEHNPPGRKLYNLDYTRHRVYLAGSTTGHDWQRKFIDEMLDLRVDVFNPRPQHNHTWELEHISVANVISLYFDPLDTSSDGLVIFGLVAKTDRLIVCCPDGFHRKSEVDAVCLREDIHTVSTLELLIANTIARISPRSLQGIGYGQ